MTLLKGSLKLLVVLAVLLTVALIAGNVGGVTAVYVLLGVVVVTEAAYVTMKVRRQRR
jgi:hypothetical protein